MLLLLLLLYIPFPRFYVCLCPMVPFEITAFRRHASAASETHGSRGREIRYHDISTTRFRGERKAWHSRCRNKNTRHLNPLAAPETGPTAPETGPPSPAVEPSATDPEPGGDTPASVHSWGVTTKNSFRIISSAMWGVRTSWGFV